MAIHRIFEIPAPGDDKHKIVYIPGLRKLFLVDANQTLPQTVTDGINHSCHSPHRQSDLVFRVAHLIVNTKCNLRCVYCYANAGDTISRVMSEEVAKAAVRKVATDAAHLQYPVFEVGFIGGEATLSLPLLQSITRYAHRQSDEVGIPVRLGLVTNGVFGNQARQWIQREVNYITFSLDGPADVHDQQRPTVNNRGSFQTLWPNAQAITDAGLSVGFRCTVSTINVDRLPELVELIHEHFPRAILGIEPLQECGRCSTTAASTPDGVVYTGNFIKALRRARELGVRIKTSSLRFKDPAESLSFCGVDGRNFAITPEGFVTACTRVVSSTDPMSRHFYFGRYDRETRDFVFDLSRYQELKKLTVDHIPACDECFARYSCKGDCAIVKADIHPFDFGHQSSSRCEAIRTITQALFALELGVL